MYRRLFHYILVYFLLVLSSLIRQCVFDVKCTVVPVTNRRQTQNAASFLPSVYTESRRIAIPSWILWASPYSSNGGGGGGGDGGGGNGTDGSVS